MGNETCSLDLYVDIVRKWSETNYHAIQVRHYKWKLWAYKAIKLLTKLNKRTFKAFHIFLTVWILTKPFMLNVTHCKSKKRINLGFRLMNTFKLNQITVERGSTVNVHLAWLKAENWKGFSTSITLLSRNSSSRTNIFQVFVATHLLHPFPSSLKVLSLALGAFHKHKSLSWNHFCLSLDCFGDHFLW